MIDQIFQHKRAKVFTAITLLFLLLAIGVTGFMSIANYAFIDALYMTVITITTVGFGEVDPLNAEAKLFTVILILISVVVVGFALSVITEYIISRNNVDNFKKRRMQKKINALKNHTIICGYGRNGKQAAKKLLAHNKPFVIIETNKELIERFQSDDIPFFHGDSNEDGVLLSAGLERASTLITTLPDDADNLFTVLSARQLKSDLCIISRASQENSYKKLKLAGANNVIMPDRIGGDHMASLVVVPDLIEFLDNLSIVGSSNVNIEEVHVNQLYDVSNEIRTIKDLDLRNLTGCTVIGFKDGDGEYVVNPEAETELRLNSKVIVLGRPEQIKKLNTLYNIDQ